MSHFVEALVIRSPHERHALAGLADLHKCVLPQDAVLIPMVEPLVIQLRARYPAERENPYGTMFESLEPAVEAFAVDLSREGPVVYFETEYHGGTGGQAALLWRHGAVAMPPRQGPIGPISACLREIGVEKGSQFDEFDALNLVQHRFTEDWLKEG